MIKRKVRDRIYGTIYGQAIGDALGKEFEFLSANKIKKEYPNGISSYDDLGKKTLKRGWKNGEWTDDTDQMMCILDSILSYRRIVPKDIAKRMIDWAIHDGRGMGSHTRRVFLHPKFLEDPLFASEYIWDDSGKYSAPNGGLMRTSVVGVWDYTFPDKVAENAETVCKITHFDPKCVASCIAASVAISSLIVGVNYIRSIVLAEKYASVCDENVFKYLFVDNLDLDELELDGENIGFTYKTLSAGFWSLINADSFKDGVLSIIHAGGDTDTNGAVAGALLGARFGYSSIPKEWITGLDRNKELEEKTYNLINHIDFLHKKWNYDA